MGDRSQEIVAAVAAASDEERQLAVVGSGSKRDWLPESDRGALLSLAEHTGIESYQPSELVVTARAGTSLKELELELTQHDQMLAFEPPQYYGGGSLGGAIACGHSGPARPWCGSARDAVLGVDVVNGKAERMSFGGQVMKNVAGYDVSRLFAGSYGTLGALLAVSVRVQPAWEAQQTVVLALTASEGLDLVRSLSRQPLPLTATCWLDGALHLRLAGNPAAVHRAVETIGGEPLSDAGFWSRLRDHQHEFFKPHPERAGALWRVATPPAAPLPDVEDLLVTWGGGLRWMWHEDADLVSEYALGVGGWAWQLGADMPIESAIKSYMFAIKRAFDPKGTFASRLELDSD